MPDVAPQPELRLAACHACGLVQALPLLAPRRRAICCRCRATLDAPGRRSRCNQESAAAALAGLILYPLAISLPILRVEQMGRRSDASIWEGSLGLLRDGELFVGAVVFLCSILVPLLKLAGLLALTSVRSPAAHRHRAWIYRAIEWAGRWGMLDVLLIAILVAWIKMGDLVEVRPGPAAFTFTLVVLLSLIASARFDPHALWIGVPMKELRP